MNKKLLLLVLCFAGSSAFAGRGEWVTVEVAEQRLRALEMKAKETRKHIELATFFQWVLSLKDIKEDEQIMVLCDENITISLAGESFVLREHTTIPEVSTMIIPFIAAYRDPAMKKEILGNIKKTLGGADVAALEKQKRELRELLRDVEKAIVKLRKQLGLSS